MRSTDQKRVAELARVSQSTISRVLNNSPLIKEEVRNRVMKVMDELDYHPDGIARSFVGEKTMNLGFILCDRTLSHPFYFRLLEGIEKEVKAHGYKLFFSTAQEFLSHKMHLPDTLKEKLTDGIILSGKIDEKLLHILRERNIPFILAGNYNFEGVNKVSWDATKGAHEGVRCLIELGHRNIGFISGPLAYQVNLELLKGYELALQETGIGYNEDFIQSDEQEDVAKLIAKLFALPTVPTAIFAVNDMMAIKAMEQLKEKGIKIPEDISIVGCGDIELSSHVTPSLTTIRIFLEDLGKMAVKKIMECIYGNDNLPHTTIVPHELVVRESCARHVG